ncbi:MAG TPA: hypothetical protein VF355_06355 [Anaerolineaceae bacterium]|jgi:hypothetical protein
MKPLKLGLRVWFTITSLVSFLAGWMLLSHAGKPAPLLPPQTNQDNTAVTTDTSTATPLPTLQPLPSLDQLTSGSAVTTNQQSLQALPSLPSTTSRNFFPSFRGRSS